MATHPETRDILPVVLAGGTGTRLWPLSRELYPKQFLRLAGKTTLLQRTLSRLAVLCCRDPVIVCSDEHRFIVAEQCRRCGVDVDSIVLEPAARNTAPAAALAALRATADGENPVLLLVPADHQIADESGFSATVGRAVPFAERGGIVVFGVSPSHPATGYGYVKTGAEATSDGSAATVAEFTEKPPRRVAERYLAEGGWYWNSGMFLVRAGVYLKELKACRPDIHEVCLAASSTGHDDGRSYRPGDAFLRCPSESIDRAVMERTRRGIVVPTDIGWDDIGDWGSLAALAPRDDDGNTVEGDVIAIDCRDCHLSTRNRLLVALGVDGIVVVDTADALLVVAKDRTQDVALAVDRLRRECRHEHRVRGTEYRPRSHAETLQTGDGFRLRRLSVEPGKSLTVPMPRHGSAHWVVVGGTAEVACGDRRSTLAVDESTHLTHGKRHRLTNIGQEPLVVIEVQTSSSRP